MHVDTCVLDQYVMIDGVSLARSHPHGRWIFNIMGAPFPPKLSTRILLTYQYEISNVFKS